MNSKRSIFDFWLWKMAWRDSRNHWKRLFLFVSSIILGIAALVAINSFGEDLEQAIDDQAKTLLGADYVIRSRQPYSEETEALIDSIGGDQSRENRFSSMVYFLKNGGTRLVQIRALEGKFPYYGELETEPPTNAETFQEGQNALVDEGMMIQFNVQPGDSVKIGAVTFNIAGKLKKIPGEAVAAAIIGPRVYIPLSYLNQTGLIQPGSR